jgi:hypothetical protein
MRAVPIARMSFCRVFILSMNAFTPVALVKMIQSNDLSWIPSPGEGVSLAIDASRVA